MLQTLKRNNQIIINTNISPLVVISILQIQCSNPTVNYFSSSKFLVFKYQLLSSFNPPLHQSPFIFQILVYQIINLSFFNTSTQNRPKYQNLSQIILLNITPYFPIYVLI